jgi:hypothetical protein
MPDFAAINNAFRTSQFAELLRLLDDHYGSALSTDYSILKSTIEAALNQGQMPPPATLQAIERLIDKLQPKTASQRLYNSPTSGTFFTADILNWPVETCLRPTCTRTVLSELLVRRQSVNLTGESGQGKSRLLEDIKNIVLGQGIRIAMLNLKDHRLQYEHFLQSMAQQLGLTKRNYTRFEDLCFDLSLQNGHPALLLIDKLEVLNEYSSNDSRYNARFVSSLNLLKNRDQIHLLCASREWLKEVQFAGETSLLTLHHIPITALSRQEIQHELQRRLSGHALLDNDAHLRQTRAAVQAATQPCTFLERFISAVRMNYVPRQFKKLLNDLQHGQ